MWWCSAVQSPRHRRLRFSRQSVRVCFVLLKPSIEEDFVNYIPSSMKQKLVSTGIQILSIDQLWVPFHTLFYYSVSRIENISNRLPFSWHFPLLLKTSGFSKSPKFSQNLQFLLALDVVFPFFNVSRKNSKENVIMSSTILFKHLWYSRFNNFGIII